MAQPKLKKVPIKTYSVKCLSFALFKSPNLKIDFAANKKPIPSQKLATTKPKINNRSKIPMYLPALNIIFSLVSCTECSCTFLNCW